MTPERFAAFDEPGWGRIAASLSSRPDGTRRTVLSYEARTALGDPGSALRFARYWFFVRPFARHIMRAHAGHRRGRRRGPIAVIAAR